ncbi:hypothetical protein FAZ15_01110 [Sphingobacterium olei]|uniref:Uncharacterized protein n=1 Tax=Sphingobacterium olei TaxID=2571155 RepID=A0A4U0P823_9SPHI|nr:hypothetical protein [Sphingobacterium olei]TJZ62932.1 hypothetical protein FAZ15_01110 [Sphingobacterium olei]
MSAGFITMFITFATMGWLINVARAKGSSTLVLENGDRVLINVFMQEIRLYSKQDGRIVIISDSILA